MVPTKNLYCPQIKKMTTKSTKKRDYIKHWNSLRISNDFKWIPKNENTKKSCWDERQQFFKKQMKLVKKYHP